MADVSSQSDCSIKKSRFRNERYVRKSIYHGIEEWIEKSIPHYQSGITLQTSWCQTVIQWSSGWVFLSTPHTSDRSLCSVLWHTHYCWNVRVAEWLVLLTSDHEVPVWIPLVAEYGSWLYSNSLWKHLFKYTENFTTKNWKFSDKKFYILHISDQNIDCRYSLPPWWGGSNQCPHTMLLSRNKKNNVYPCKPQFYYIKVGFKGVKIV